MKKYIFVSAFTNIVDKNNRIRTIIKKLEGEKIVLTTDFNHGKKRYYNVGEAEDEKQVLLHVLLFLIMRIMSSKNMRIQEPKRNWTELRM